MDETSNKEEQAIVAFALEGPVSEVIVHDGFVDVGPILVGATVECGWQDRDGQPQYNSKEGRNDPTRHLRMRALKTRQPVRVAAGDREA